MSKTVTIEIPAASEALVRQLLALHDELQALALSSADGTVLDDWRGGRRTQRPGPGQKLTGRGGGSTDRGRRKRGGAPIHICSCGQAKENRGWSSRQFVTAVGVLNLKRLLWTRIGRPKTGDS